MQEEEEPSEGHGKEHDEQYEAHHGQPEDEEILRPEDRAEENETPFCYIKKEQGPAVHLDERQTEKRKEVNVTD